jgi:hypothetical protein
MSLKTFKVQSGLDIDGVVLSASASELLVSGSVISTEAYVDSAIAGIPGTTTGPGLTTDASGALVPDIGTGLQINALSNDLEVDTDTIATKTYVDGVAQGLDVKQSVKTATKIAVGLSGYGGANPLVIDGITIADGDRVLLKNQENSFENGIYVYSEVTDSLVRASDADTVENLNNGAFTFVEAGDSNAGKGFVASVTVSGLGGFESVTWSQFSEAGSFITAVNETQFDVTSGELALSASVIGQGLVYATEDQISVNIGDGLAFDNSNRVSLDSSHKFNNLDLIDSNQAQTKSKLDSDQRDNNDSDSFKDLVSITALSAGNVEVISGEFFVTSEFNTGATIKRRISKIAWLWDGDLVAPSISYNEYSVIETGGSISGYDLQVVYQNNNVVLQHKATVASGETLTSQAYSVSQKPPTFA